MKYLLMPLLLIACGDKEEDSAVEAEEAEEVEETETGESEESEDTGE